MADRKAGKLGRASALALSLLGACATETQSGNENLALEPNGGSSGNAGSGGDTAGTDPVGTAGSFVTAGTGGSGTAGTFMVAGTGGSDAGGAGGGAAGGGMGGGGAGGAGGKGGAGGNGGKAGSGGGGSGGSPGNPCATGKLAITSATAQSLENDTFPASNAHDGNATSRWASEQMVDPQWIWFDLGAVAHVSRVNISWEAAYATSYRLEIADSSNGPWTAIHTQNAGDGGMDNVTTLTASNGRYVRMLGLTRSTMYGFSIYEFEIYGDQDEDCD